MFSSLMIFGINILFFIAGNVFKLNDVWLITWQIIVRIGSSEIMRYVALMLMQSCRLFFNNWAGQEVADYSVQVPIAA